MMIKGKLTAAAAAWLALGGTAAQASTACWSPVEQAAAKVRNLQTRLMDATLRCQLVGADITPVYNQFVRVNRPTLQGANSVLRSRLGEKEYDRFITFLANDSGSAMIDAEHCAAAAQIADAGMVAAGDVQKLVAIEEKMGLKMDLPGGACPITFTLAAANAPAADAPAAVAPAAAAPAGEAPAAAAPAVEEHHRN